MEVKLELLEIYNKRHKLIGYFDGNTFMNKKKKVIGVMEENTVKIEQSKVRLKLDEHDDIFINDNKSQVGFILDSKIYNGDGGILFELLTDKGQILDNNGKSILYLEGNSVQPKIENYFGVVAMFLESVLLDKFLHV
jgi:hypothetical protein